MGRDRVVVVFARQIRASTNLQYRSYYSGGDYDHCRHSGLRAELH